MRRHYNPVTKENIFSHKKTHIQYSAQLERMHAWAKIGIEIPKIGIEIAKICIELKLKLVLQKWLIKYLNMIKIHEENTHKFKTGVCDHSYVINSIKHMHLYTYFDSLVMGTTCGLLPNRAESNVFMSSVSVLEY